MISAHDKLSDFKLALAATIRAIAKDRTVQLTFGPPAVDEKNIALPPLTELPTSNELPYIRGIADRGALFVRYHHAALHESLRPKANANAMLFDLLETIRVETLGSRNMQGVRHNLAMRFSRDLSSRLAGNERSFYALVELYARKYIQRIAIPDNLSGTQSHAPIVKSLEGPLLGMEPHIENQKRFAMLALEFIRNMADISVSFENDKPRPDTDNSAIAKEVGSSQAPAPTPNRAAMPDTSPSLADISMAALKATARLSPQTGGDITEASYPSNHPPSLSPSQPYHAYIRDFDEEIQASALATPGELDALRKQLDQKLGQFHSITAKLAVRLQRLLLAKQARRWVFDGIRMAK